MYKLLFKKNTVKIAVALCAVLLSALFISCPQANILKVMEYGFSTVQFPNDIQASSTTTLHTSSVGRFFSDPASNTVTFTGILKNPGNLTWSNPRITIEKNGSSLTDSDYSFALQSGFFSVTFNSGVFVEGESYTIFLPKQSVSNANAFGNVSYTVNCYTPVTWNGTSTGGIDTVGYTIAGSNLTVTWNENLTIPTNYLGNSDLYVSDGVYYDSTFTGLANDKKAWVCVTVKETVGAVEYKQYVQAAAKTATFSTIPSGAFTIYVEIADSKGFFVKEEKNVAMQGVSFDANGGTPTPAQQNIVVGASVLTAPTAPTKTGYTFAGWYADPGFSGSAVTFPYQLTNPLGIILYAKWAPLTTLTATVTVTNGTCTAGATTGITTDAVYNATITANAGYTLPSAITVHQDGNALTLATDYTYNASTGAIQILAGKVKGNIVITATATENTTIYLNGVSGNDTNSGLTLGQAVATFTKAAGLLGPTATNSIIITGMVTVSTPETWNLSNRMVKRGATTALLVDVTTGSLILENIIFDGQGGLGGLGGSQPTAFALIGIASGGTVTLNSGAILQNNNNGTNSGGGIASSGTIIMKTGSKIWHNKSGGVGGGVFISGGCTMTMTGGEIINNASALSSSNGGGILVAGSGLLNMSGNPIVKNNTKGPGGNPDNISLDDNATNQNLKVTSALTGSAGDIGLSPRNTAAGTSVAVGNGHITTSDVAKFSSDTGAVFAISLGNLIIQQLTMPVASGAHLLDAIVNAPTTGATQVINLTQDLTVDSTINVSGGKKISVQGSGKKLTRDNSNTGNLFTVSGSSSSLTLGAGVTLDGNCNVAGTPVLKSPMISVSGGTVDIKADIKNSYGENGGAVSITGGTVTFDTGEISGNKGENYGGAVYLSGGTFTMNGGSIKNNSLEVTSLYQTPWGGGGVCVFGGIFNLTAGTISNNTARMGGGVLVFRGTFNMTGGTITTNKAVGNGGNFGGGGVYLGLGSNAANGTINLQGGTIQNNQVTGSADGGGVRAVTGTAANITGTTITGNTAAGSGDQYFISLGINFNGTVLGANAVQD